MSGSLLVVATPIGNLGDISDRARKALESASVIACEDTRNTGNLLKLLGLHKPLVSNHGNNEKDIAENLAARVAAGETVAVVSDAGTPAISDPGFRVVRECRRRGLTVTPIPGACAFVAALSASGLPTNAFTYRGFLQPKSAARIRYLENEAKASAVTEVLYESCHRIGSFVNEIVEVLGPDRVICVAREVTKLHETILVGRAADIAPKMIGNNLRGEFVVIIAPPDFVL